MNVHVLTGRGKPDGFNVNHVRYYFTSEDAARAAIPELVLDGSLRTPITVETAELRGGSPDGEPAVLAEIRTVVDVHPDAPRGELLAELRRLVDNDDHCTVTHRGFADLELERRRRAVEHAATAHADTGRACGLPVTGPTAKRLCDAVDALREYAPGALTTASSCCNGSGYADYAAVPCPNPSCPVAIPEGSRR